jgi:hypothetical protein
MPEYYLLSHWVSKEQPQRPLDFGRNAVIKKIRRMP